MRLQEDTIRFGIPLEDIKKGTNGKGEEVYLFEGIASTPDKDTQGETLYTNKFDLSEFSQVNYNHQGTKDANAVLGDITEHQFKKGGELFLRGELYPEMPMTKSVVNMMRRAKKKGKKLQLSVEGSVLQRGSTNKTDPRYKQIVKAKLTGVAITSNPINTNTFCDLIEKGVTSIDWQFSQEDEAIMKAVQTGEVITEEKLEDIEKAVVAGTITGRETTNKPLTLEPLKQESVEGTTKCTCGKEDCEYCRNKKVLSKSSAYESIFNYFYPISFEQATQVYNLTEKIAQMKKGSITPETLKKAHEILDLASADTNESQTQGEGNKEEKTLEVAKELVKGEEFSKLEKAEVVDRLQKSGFSDEIAYNVAGTHVPKKETNPPAEKTGAISAQSITVADTNIAKSLQEIEELQKSNQDNFDLKIGALGAILKSQNEMLQEIVEQNDALVKSNDALVEQVTSLKEASEKILNTPLRKAQIGNAASVERFQKSEDGSRRFNVKNKIQRTALVKELTNLSGYDTKNTRGGQYDERMLKAASDIELVGYFGDQSIPDLLKSQHKIEVIAE